MGYLQGPPPRNKNKNSDSTQNYVDRVRVPDPKYDFGGPGRGSGWRQRSLSNIDLTTQSKHSFTKQTRGYTSGLYDLYSRLDTRKETENVYTNVNANAEKVESIYDRIEQTLDTIKNTTESCSLRRTRSLAVIREETFNDLQVGGIRTRRSQLIPRAKLLDRGFFQNRTGKGKKYRDENSGGNSCAGTIDSQPQILETREADEYYANLKNINATGTVNGALLPAAWNNNNDKSDLDSLDSDYFKNSLHQSDGKKEQIVAESCAQDDGNTETQVQNIYIGDNQSIGGGGSGSIGYNESIPDYYAVDYDGDEHAKQDALRQLDNACKSNSHTVDVVIENHCELNGNYGELQNGRHDDGITDTEEETLGRKSKFKEDHKSVISYDSIYLSSEGSGEATITEEDKIQEYLSDNNYSTLSEYADLRKKDIEESETQPSEHAHENDNQPETNDILYSKPNKHKPKIVQCEPKPLNRLTSFSDISTRGTLERLTFVSSPPTQRKEGPTDRPVPNIRHHITTTATTHSVNNNHTVNNSNIHNHGHKNNNNTLANADNQYCSLPVANISKSLQASERIDAKLRQSCVALDEDEHIHNSITHFGRPNKKTRQREGFEIGKQIPLSFEEQPKEAPAIDLIPNLKGIRPAEKQTKRPIESKETYVIVEPIIAKREKKSKQTVVGREQIKEKKSLDEPKAKKVDEKLLKKPPTKIPAVELTSLTDSKDNIIEETIRRPVLKANDNQAVIRRNQRRRQIKSAERLTEHRERLPSNFKTTLSNTLKRRLENKAKLSTNEKPISRFVRNIDKTKNSHKTNKVHQAILESFKPRINMSRPQILNVIDSRRPTAFRSPIKSNISKELNKLPGDHNIYNTKERTHKEFQEKVDSVRTYWSKLIDEQEDESKDHYATDEYGQPQPDEIEIRPPTIPVADAESSFKKARAKPAPPTPPPLPSPAMLKPVSQSTHPPPPPLPTALPPVAQTQAVLNRSTITAAATTKPPITGKMVKAKQQPSVEIVELEDKKQAALVKVKGTADLQEFDHVRYKVVKSDTFQKNILTHSKKEAEFDGLLQYLQDYSFQELLTKNNVVIIEPIRTKIEKISSKSSDSQIMACKITGGAGKLTDGKGNLKRHFFYHPVRVNKELLDEELPSPDTVRKAKKLFEEMLRFRSMKNGDRSIISINENCKGIDKKFLHFDASSYNGNGNGVVGGLRKWDSSSLSSGVSSGDLSSPCDCNDNEDNKMISNGDDLCESYYVSQDILEKIRECGSSVTYYGGRVLNNHHSTGVSPIAKAIMREIHNGDTICGVCQPHNCPHRNKLFTSFCETDSNNSHLGVKLRLVKSNSCASRLELTGTHPDDGRINRNNSVSNIDHEESVRTMIRRIESNSFNSKKVPRIIESKCIEKTNDAKSKQVQFQFSKDADAALTNQQKGDHRLGPVEILSQVSVNNHINSLNAAMATDKPPKSNIIPRNRNVDLALEMSKSPNKNVVTTRTVKDQTNGLKKNSVGGDGTANNDKITTSPPKAKIIDNVSLQNMMEDLSAAIAKQADQIGNNQMSQQNSKLTKWDNIAVYDEKNYITNDISLKQKPKYDDIEFEEYEVIDPTS